MHLAGSVRASSSSIAHLVLLYMLVPASSPCLFSFPTSCLLPPCSVPRRRSLLCRVYGASSVCTWCPRVCGASPPTDALVAGAVGGSGPAEAAAAAVPVHFLFLCCRSRPLCWSGP